MGILDDLEGSINRGAASVSRGSKKMQINGQINDVNKKRQSLAAQLGASLYEITKDDPKFREGRESLYDEMAACDIQRAALQAQIAELEAEAAAAQAAAAAAQSTTCPNCGARLKAGDLFCSGCGSPAPKPEPAPAAAGGVVCPQCGTVAEPDGVFCMNCGTKLPEPEPESTPESAPEPEATPEPEPASVEEKPADPVCPQCGAIVQAGNAFCMSCGAKL